ncbi:hypothetical protein Acsp04_51050 [Actinomadura sp. NBRC 104425]|nr:hypothetical protein Acsp04_51050 [Actinomadura sp. NBRC 104425]
MRSYLNRFGLDVPVTEISQAFAGTPRPAAPVVRSPRAVQVQQPVAEQVQVPQVKPELEPELELEPESELEPAGPPNLNRMWNRNVNPAVTSGTTCRSVPRPRRRRFVKWWR